MFSTKIKQTPFCDAEVNSYFEHIKGIGYSSDVTFISTLRALLFPRMKEGDSITLDFKILPVGSAETIGQVPVEIALTQVTQAVRFGNSELKIVSFKGEQIEGCLALLALIESKFERYYPNWQRVDRVRDFFRGKLDTVCFINPLTKNTLVFAVGLTNALQHYIQCSIPVLLPWYFPQDERLSQKEMSLLEATRGGDANQYLQALKSIGENYDFRAQRIQNLLKGFESSYIEHNCKQVEDALASIVERLEDLNHRVGEAISQKNEKEIELLGYKMKLAEDDGRSEIMDYFLCNKNIVLLKRNKNTITFAVKAYLEYYDEDLAKSVIDNPNSFIYETLPEMFREDMKRFMTAVFLDETLRIKTCAAYKFNIDGNIQGIRENQFGDEFSDCLPNPHIQHYACLGTYASTINTLLMKRDYVGAIEMCAASCRSLNFADSTVASRFIIQLKENNGKFVELPDGKMASVSEAMKYLKEAEQNGN